MKVLRSTQYQDHFGMKVLRSTQYQDQVGMKVLRSTQIPGPSSYKKILESIQYQDKAGTFKSWYQSTKTRLGCSKVKTQPAGLYPYCPTKFGKRIVN
jgi:hypothetical protein